MKKILFISLLAICAASCSSSTDKSSKKDGLKVMIQADFEGVTDVVTFDEIYPGHVHFLRNCEQLTNEVNAAVEGALAAGATEIIVRDGHSSNISIDPMRLNPKAKLIRGRKPNTPETMVIGIDSTYDALLFIGAHARAGITEGVLSHTMSLKVVDLSINGTSMSEPAFNSLYAGQFGVPVVFVAGDSETSREAKETFGENVVTTITKEPIGRTCAVNYSPENVCRQIKKDVEKALGSIDKGTVFKMDKPYRMELKVMKGTTPDTLQVISYQSDTLMSVMKRFWQTL